MKQEVLQKVDRVLSKLGDECQVIDTMLLDLNLMGSTGVWKRSDWRFAPTVSDRFKNNDKNIHNFVSYISLYV